MRLVLELMDRWERPIVAEMVIRRDTVELYCHGRLAGSADRDLLSGWLRQPAGVLAYDGCAWLDLGYGGVALHVDDLVPAFVLRDHIVADLRTRV